MAKMLLTLSDESLLTARRLILRSKERGEYQDNNENLLDKLETELRARGVPYTTKEAA